MHFQVEVPFQIESTAKWMIKTLTSMVSMSLLWLIFHVVFVLPSINTVFDDSFFSNIFCWEQTIWWFKIIGDCFGLLTAKREKAMKLVSLSISLKVSYFVGI